MADIEVVIKIDEEIYKRLQSLSKGDYFEHDLSGNLMRRIANGISLPKGHGRLIDADALEKKMCDREEELGDDRAMWESSAVSVALDMFAPTIIEAESEESKNE